MEFQLIRSACCWLTTTIEDKRFWEEWSDLLLSVDPPFITVHSIVYGNYNPLIRELQSFSYPNCSQFLILINSQDNYSYDVPKVYLQ